MEQLLLLGVGGAGVEASSPFLPRGVLEASPLGGAGLGWLLERKASVGWKSQSQVFSSTCFLFCVNADAPDGPPRWEKLNPINPYRAHQLMAAAAILVF